ncbi:hypothetical protein GCM10017771_95660 [Streptomyces capitiformicae]|uniref:Uncharacterized protein n=1 Tax=Streptomyces capitiformicae TaxID=2014920 RepID=A0A918ZUY4_9ACTN|nr:hypothetical protein GCM10017771_95660 [Streptomyces capitiformicae]
MSRGELVDGAFHSGADRVGGLPDECPLLGADADLQVAEFSRGQAQLRASRGSGCKGGGPDTAGAGPGDG